MESIDGPLPGNQDLVSYTYDPVTGDRLTETRPLVGTTTYTYDAAGNVETMTDVNGVVTTFTYDGRNRQLSANAQRRHHQPHLHGGRRAGYGHRRLEPHHGLCVQRCGLR